MTSAPTPPLTLDVSRPFTRAAALAAGLPPGQLRTRAYRRVLHGVYISSVVAPSPLDRVRAALVVHPPGARASHTSACRVYDLPIPARLVDEHVTVARLDDRRFRREVRPHLTARLRAATVVAGVPVSAPDDLFVEMAELLNLVELVVLGDAMVRSGRTTPTRLVEVSRDCRDRNSRLARRAARFVRADVDSPMESRLRMLLVLAGLPEPQVNHVVRRETGAVLYRFDLSWPAIKVVVEYDGRHHRDDLDQWEHDLERDDWFADAEWLVVKVFARGVYVDPEHTLRRVARALRRRGCPGVPRRLRDDWRPYFSVSPRAKPMRRAGAA